MTQPACVYQDVDHGGSWQAGHSKRAQVVAGVRLHVVNRERKDREDERGEAGEKHDPESHCVDGGPMTATLTKRRNHTSEPRQCNRYLRRRLKNRFAFQGRLLFLWTVGFGGSSSSVLGFTHCSEQMVELE